MPGKFLLLSLLLAPVFVLAQGATETVVATGMAPSYRGAINEALVSALEQKQGVQISVSERMLVESTTDAVSVSENGVLSESQRLNVDDSIRKNLQKFSRGKISGYRVLSGRYDEAAKKYVVELEVALPGKYVVGRPPDNLRKMVVLPFNVRGETFGWYGQPQSTVSWSRALMQKLNVFMTQTRKFSMLDREFGKEIDAELSRLTAANAVPEDVVRLNQKLGTDYLVVGSIVFSDVNPPAVNPFTGEAIVSAQYFAEVTFRVLLAPTGQLKWTDTVKIDASKIGAADALSFISGSAEAAARDISENIMDNILPFEVVALSDGQLVIGEGGKRLRTGDRFVVSVLGEAVRDTRTGEIIDELERPVATAEITSVSGKLSYARVIEGDIAQVKAGARLRRIPKPAETVAVPITTTIRMPNAGGGVVVPF